MTALQCPTRIFLARHAEAAYETDLVTDDGGWLTPRGREQAAALGGRLRGERIARVWSSPLSRAVQTAELAAAALGVDVVVREGLREYGVGTLAGAAGGEAEHLGPVFEAWTRGDDTARIPGAERVSAIVGRVARVLGEVADEHPGEAVLVVGHGGAILATVPELVGLPRGRGLTMALPPAGLVALEVDADGWRLLSGDTEGRG